MSRFTEYSVKYIKKKQNKTNKLKYRRSMGKDDAIALHFLKKLDFTH